MPLDLTRTQWRVLGFIKAYLAAEDRIPTGHDTAKAFGWKSANSAFEHFEALVRRGALEKRGHGFYRLARAEPSRQDLEDQALEHQITAAGLMLRASRLPAPAGCHFTDEGDANRYLRLQNDLIESRHPEVVLRTQLESGCGSAATTSGEAWERR